MKLRYRAEVCWVSSKEELLNKLKILNGYFEDLLLGRIKPVPWKII